VQMLPNFFVVGAARSGTTSLDQYLAQHPEIFITSRKESHYFAADQFPPCTGPGDAGIRNLLVRDAGAYAELFASAAGKKAIGESSAFYLHLPGTAERIAQAVPDAKIIMLLREPVDRTYSAYMFLARDGREALSLEQGLEEEEERKQQGFEPMWRYKELSFYYEHVRQYIEVFGEQQVKVLLYEEFYANPAQALRDVFTFLGVKEDVAIDTSVRYNLSGMPKSRKLYTPLNRFIFNPNGLEKRIKSLIPLHLRKAWASKLIGLSVERISIDPQIQAQLRAYYAEDVKQLQDLLQRDLACWGYGEPGAMEMGQQRREQESRIGEYKDKRTAGNDKGADGDHKGKNLEGDLKGTPLRSR